MSKLTRERVARAMLSSVENYLFEVVDSVEHDAGALSQQEHDTLCSWVMSAVEKAVSEMEGRKGC